MVRVQGIQIFYLIVTKSTEKFAIERKNIYTFALEITLLNN